MRKFVNIFIASSLLFFVNLNDNMFFCTANIEVMQHVSYAVKRWLQQKSCVVGIFFTCIVLDHGWRDSILAPLVEP